MDIPADKLRKIPIKQIKVAPGRARQEFKNITGLADSIQKLGQLQPIVVAPMAGQPDMFQLVAGERRYRASLIAGNATMLAVLRDDLNPYQLKEAELEENIQRENLTWPEQVENLRQIHELKSTNEPGWNIVKTAELTEKSIGGVSMDVALAEELKARPDLADKVKHLPKTAAAKQIKQLKEAEETHKDLAAGKIQATSTLLNGDCRDLIKKLPANSINLLLTDPPYGLENITSLVEHGSTKMAMYGTMSDDHNLTLPKILELLKELAPELNRVLKPSSHFYMFCGFQHAGDFINALSPHLEFQPPILCWYRKKPSAPGMGYNYLSTLECIIYGYKPPRERRLAQNKSNLLEHPEPPREFRIYPTEKPVSLLRELIEQSTNPGETVLDPFAGSASTLVAARQLGRKALGFEKNPDSWARAQNRLNQRQD